MRPLPQTRKEKTLWQTDSSAHREKVMPAILLAMSAWTLGCGGGGAGSVAPSSPPPPSITVSITPSSGSVLLGESLSFSASVSNTTNTSVTWSVNGTAEGSSQAGTITASGAYTAPADLPAGGTVQVTATSIADSSASATANVTITSDISVSLSPNTANVELGAIQPFQASIKSQGRPDPSVRWSLAGTACPNACGSVDGNGNYSAPQILPSPATVSLTASSVADPTKQSTAIITITSHFTLQLSAPANVQAGSAVTLTATLTPVPGSNPSNALSWSLQGTGCTSSACGVLTVTTGQSVGAAPIGNIATYTAPSTAPQPATVLITVTPLADPSKLVQANITILPGSGISLSPPTAMLAVNQSLTLSAAQSSSPSGSLNWSVNGIPGGSYVYGQICVLGSNPCQPIASSSTTQVNYVAPGSVPAANPVSISVSSASNPALTASAQISVLSQFVVTVLPNNVTLAPSAVQSFAATVLGSANQGVTWQLQGTGCSTAGSCGSIDASGAYTAPAVAPTPSNFTVIATSQIDPTQSGSASITISSGPNIQALHPASVYAGGLDGFTLQVNGSGFAEASPGPGSTLIIGGTARLTSCTTTGACTAAVTSTDVAQPGNLSIQLQNPGGATSNLVQLVVAAPNASNGSISLTSAAPVATGENLVVVEPTTAGIDSSGDDFDLAVAAIGTFNTSTNICNLGGSPIPLVRPSSGTSTADICVFSEGGLDTTMTYSVSGPGDVAVTVVQPAGLGIIHLTLQLPATAAPGARTLFIQDLNLDQAAATGVLEIQ
jgi:hypothetical protein